MRGAESREFMMAVYHWLDDHVGAFWANVFLWSPVVLVALFVLWEFDVFDAIKRGESADSEIRRHFKESFLQRCQGDDDIEVNCQELMNRHDPLCRWSEDTEKYYECVRREETPGWEPPKAP